MNSLARRRGPVFASTLTAGTIAAALAATDASAQTASTCRPTRVHVRVHSTGHCSADVTVAVLAPAAENPSLGQFTLQHPRSTNPAPAPPPPNYAYPQRYVLLHVVPPPPFDPRYARLSTPRHRNPHSGSIAALALGAVGMIRGAELIALGAFFNGNVEHAGDVHIVVGTTLAVAGFPSLVMGTIAIARRHARAHITGSVAMTQGGAVISAGMVF